LARRPRRRGHGCLRLARPDDAEHIKAIYAPIVRDTIIAFETESPSLDEMRRRILSTLVDYPWLVAEQDDGVLGYAYASQHRTRAAYRWACDVTIYLAEAARGQGLGARLYSKLFRMLERQGFYQAFAGISLPNAPSIALHKKLGFRHLGTYAQVGYKLGGWHDVGWWRRQLAEITDSPAEPRRLADVCPDLL
jgi:L-amino acid N-acyltransferase YncA